MNCGLIWTTGIYNGADCLECGGVWRKVKKNKVEEEEEKELEKKVEKKEEEKKKELEEKKREIMIQIFQQMVEAKKLAKERLEIHRKWFNDDESETEDAGRSSSSALWLSRWPACSHTVGSYQLACKYANIW